MQDEAYTCGPRVSDQTGASERKPVSKITNLKLEVRHDRVSTENEREGVCMR